MRRLSRLDRSIARIRPRSHSSSPFQCSSCQIQKSPFSSTARPEATKKRALFDEDKMRRRIWGEDTQPDEKSLSEAPKTSRKQSKITTQEFDAYEPAETWDGLEEVGGEEVETAANSHKNVFRGFLTARNVTDPVELKGALRQALIEVFALHQAGKPLESLDKLAPRDNSALMREVQIVPSVGKEAHLEFSGTASLEGLVRSLSDNKTKPSVEEPLNLEESTSQDSSIVAEEDSPAWLQVSLEDPKIKFAIIKRTMRLTGMFFSDVKIKQTRTAEDLLCHMVTPPKPKTLVDAIVEKGDLMDLPNVKIYHRRITPIDREKSVGRWKIIEKELVARGLPVTGH